MAADADPFDAVHVEVSASVRALTAGFKAFENAGPDLADRDSAALQEQLRGLDWDLQDLEDAVSVAQANPMRFSLTAAAISERREAVARLRAEVDRVRLALEDAVATNPAPVDTRQALLGLGSVAAEKSSESNVVRTKATIRPPSSLPSNDRNIQELELQDAIVREQDESLDDLAVAVRRIGTMGKEMHNELHEHGVLLDDLESGFDNTSSRMRSIQRRLDDFVSETTAGQFCTIVVLFFAFIVLTFLVFAT